MLSSLWLHEQYKNTIFSTKVESVLYRQQSKFQMVEIVQTTDWGKVLMLDGCMMVAEADEFFYHEAIVHLPMSMLSAPKTALVIGGGDGGTARELAKYPSLESIHVVEIDGDVIESCREHLPLTGCGFDDSRVQIHVQDAFDFLKLHGQTDSPLKFDLITCDGSDPTGFAAVLIELNFYNLISKCLSHDGIFITQSGSPISQKQECRSCWDNLNAVFPSCRYAWSLVPTYPAASWSFTLASKASLYDRKQNSQQSEYTKDCKFWTAPLKDALLSEPGFIRELLCPH